jgi:hypothetical protein
MIAVAVLSTGLISFVLRRPVWFTFTDFGEISRPSFTIFNPLRNRAPERVSEQMLYDLHRGDVDAAMAQMHGGANDEIAEKERRYRLRRWKLVNRVDRADQVTLYYRTDRGASANLDSEVVVFLQHQKSDWLIRDYLPMY